MSKKEKPLVINGTFEQLAKALVKGNPKPKKKAKK
jgi:hypothetical protein